MGEDEFFFNIDKDSNESVSTRFRDAIARALNNNQIKPGDRVASIRVCSHRLDLSQSAVRKAFDQLIAEGWLEVRHGSGTFISSSSPILARQSIEHAGGHLETQGVRKIKDATAFGAASELSCRFGYEPISEPCGGARFEQAIELWTSDCRSQPAALSDPAGLPELREYIATWLNQSRAMKCSANNVFVMNNLQECRSFIARLLIDEHTAVMLEDPGMNRFWLQAYTSQLRPVPLDDSGIITEELARINDAHLAYISPSCQIPTGAVLSRTRREKLLQWAQAHKTIIVEEDTNCEFSFDSRIIPSIHALDDSARTFYIGAAESIFPEQMHFAFMVLPEAVRAPFTRLKSLANRCTSPILQRLMLRMFETQYVQERIRKLQRLLEVRRATLLQELDKIPPGNVIYSPAKGGTFQSVWLSSHIDDLAAYEHCSTPDLAPASPASPYYLLPAGRPGLSISFAQPVESIAACADRLRAALLAQQHTNSGSRR